MGLAVGTMGIAPVSQAINPMSNFKGKDIKVGLLLPENAGYPQLADHYLAGFKTKLLSRKAKDSSIGFQTEFYRTSDNSFYRNIKSMLFESNVDVVVVHASNFLIEGIWELFHQNERILIASVIGENVGVSLPVSPYIYINSLNLWQSNWMAGKWVAENIGHKVAIVNSFYDSGFHASNTFKLGFESGGGNHVGLFMIDPPNGTFNPGAVISEIEKEMPDTIFANLSGVAATAFLKAYLSSSLNGKVKLVASPMAVTEQSLPHIGIEACGIKSFFTWSTVLENKENADFIKLLQNKKVEVPDVFHLLGYETAMMLIAAEEKAGVGFETRSYAKALELLEMESPRGIVRMDKESHISASPYYLREVSTMKYKLINKIVSEELAVVDENNELVRNEYNRMVSGWINPYLTS